METGRTWHQLQESSSHGDWAAPASRALALELLLPQQHSPLWARAQCWLTGIVLRTLLLPAP